MQKQTVRSRRTPRVATNAQMRRAIAELRLIQEASTTGYLKPHPKNVFVNGVSTFDEWSASLDAVCGLLSRLVEERQAKSRNAAVTGAAKRKQSRQRVFDFNQELARENANL
jgi:hypothetical protein